MANHVSRGALSAIFDDSAEKIPNPTVQCVQIKRLSGATDRYLAVFSDISNFVQTMLASPIKHLVTSGQLRRGCFVRLKSFQANLVKGKRILIILDLEVLDLPECEKLGEPKPLEIKPADEEKSLPTTISSDGFYGNRPQNQPPQPQARQQPHASTMASSHADIYPIEALSPFSHKWTIKARCTTKSNIKNFQNRPGKLFNVNLLDDSGEIRATGFNEQCDLLYPLFEEGSVYYISSPCRVQLAKREFSNVNNDYELTFERGTVVEKAPDSEDVPQVRFNFRAIGDLQSVEEGTTIDVLGVLKSAEESGEVTSKTTGKAYAKRELTLVDNTGYSVRLTIWGNTATSFDATPESIIAFKGVKVSNFGGRSLSLLSSGSMTTDPDIEEAHRLKGWYDAQGRYDQFASHVSSGGASGASGGRDDPLKTITDIRDEQLGMSENPDYFGLRAAVIYIKQENFCYPACLSEGCSKKVTQQESGLWRCERCEKSHPKPEYRYILSVNVSDHTGQIWLNCFDEVGRALLGTTADQLMDLKDNDGKAANYLIQDANCRAWNFKCKAKLDNFQDQQRVRYQVSFVNPINYSVEAAKLVDQIASYDLGS